MTDLAPQTRPPAMIQMGQGNGIAAAARAGGNVGALTVEAQRAQAEVIAAVMAARAVPRDEERGLYELERTCARPKFVESAFYAFPRGGQTVTGPSIRFAEEAARCYGNIEYGVVELSRGEGVSEFLAYCWDYEKNVKKAQKFTVAHKRDVNSGVGKELTTERDIYEIGANMGARRVRSVILAVLPAWYVEDGLEAARKTLSGKGDVPLADRIRNMMRYLEGQGVTHGMVERRFGPPKDLDAEKLLAMRGLAQAIKDGEMTPSQAFPATAGEDEASTAGGAIAAAARGDGEAKPAPAPRKKAAEPAKEAPEPGAEDSAPRKEPETDAAASAPRAAPAAEAAKSAPAPAATDDEPF